jgi:hypothetical protein
LFQVPSIIVSNLREDEEKKDIGWYILESNNVKLLNPRNKMWYRFQKRCVNDRTPSETPHHSLKWQDDWWTAKMKVFGTSDCDQIEVLFVTQKYGFDLDGGFAGREGGVQPFDLNDQRQTHSTQKMHRAEVQSCLVRAS